MINRNILFLIFLFLVGSVSFFIYNKIKEPHLTVKIKKNFSKDDAVATIKMLMEKLAKDPNNIDTLNKLGEIFSSMGDWEKALLFFKRLENQIPKDPKAKEKVAMCYFYMHEYVLAFKKLKEVLKLDPNNVLVNFNIGLLYAYFLKDKNKAREHFLFVIKSNTKDAKLKSMAKEELKRLGNKKSE